MYTLENNTWNLKIPRFGEGETSTYKPQIFVKFLGSMLNFDGVGQYTSPIRQSVWVCLCFNDSLKFLVTKE